MAVRAAPAAGFEADDEVRESAARLVEWSRRPRGPAKAKSIPDSAWEKARSEAQAMMRSGDWAAALPRHFVATYALLHETVYGVEASELTPVARTRAAGAAARTLEHEFGGDKGEMAAFIRWTWQREKEREAWRRKNGKGAGHIGVWLQFSGLVTDYRLALARRKGA